jgi:hypothetical protein
MARDAMNGCPHEVQVYTLKPAYVIVRRAFHPIARILTRCERFIPHVI